MLPMHERLSVNSLCFPGANLGAMAGHWRELKPHRISFTSALLGDDLSSAQTILSEGGYRLETMTHLFLWGQRLKPFEESWTEERAKLSRVIETAARLGANSIYMMTGGHGELTWEESAECFAAAISPCVAEAEAAGVKLLVETASPLYADSHIVHSLRDTVALAEMAGIGVCIDLYACWTEAGLKQTIARAMPRCHLIQVSDYVLGDRSLPSRAVPGDGNIPLARLFDWILSAGYGGAFDFELIGPRIDAEGHLDAVRRAAENTGTMLRSLGV